MQKTSNHHNLKKAILTGVVAILVVALMLSAGHDINARAISEDIGDPKDSLPILAAIITIACLLFVASASKTLLPERRKIEDELRDFIRQCGQRGYAKHEILGILGKSGWTKGELDKYF